MSADSADLRSHVQKALGSAYALSREVGEGGMAHVFLADETVLHTDPSFRLIPPGEALAIHDDPRWIGLVQRVGLAP